MGNYGVVIDDDALEFLADMAGGDARSALNAVELGILTTPKSEDGSIHLTLDVASECIQKRVIKYDKKMATITTISYPPLSKVCVVPILMQQSTILPRCSTPEKMSNSSPDVS